LGLKIGLDIDGVVADSFPIFIKGLNKRYGKNLISLTNYDITVEYESDWDDINQFFREEMETLFESPEPMEGALQGIQDLLSAGYEIVYITMRKPGDEERITLKWLKKNKIPHAKVIFVGEMSKIDAVRENNIDIFVEDSMSNALEIAAIGVPVILLDATYNQGNMPKGVMRSLNWKQILETIQFLSSEINNKLG